MRVTDDEMRERLATTKEYSVVILHGTEKLKDASARPIVWEHGRRNFELRADGVLQIVCPVIDASGVSGIGIFAADPAETAKIMEADPAVKAGLFTYEVHPCRSIPGDALR